MTVIKRAEIISRSAEILTVRDIDHDPTNLTTYGTRADIHTFYVEDDMYDGNIGDYVAVRTLEGTYAITDVVLDLDWEYIALDNWDLRPLANA